MHSSQELDFWNSGAQFHHLDVLDIESRKLMQILLGSNIYTIFLFHIEITSSFKNKSTNYECVSLLSPAARPLKLSSQLRNTSITVWETLHYTMKIFINLNITAADTY
jgi:hypothetical protein